MSVPTECRSSATPSSSEAAQWTLCSVGVLQASTRAKKMRLLAHSFLPSALWALDLHSLYSLPFLSFSDRVHAISLPHTHWKDFLFPPPSTFIFRYKRAASAEWNGCNSLRSIPSEPECTVKGKKGHIHFQVHAHYFGTEHTAVITAENSVLG